MYIFVYQEKTGDDHESESVENQRDIIDNYINNDNALQYISEYVDDRIHSELILTDRDLKEWYKT